MSDIVSKLNQLPGVALPEGFPVEVAEAICMLTPLERNYCLAIANAPDADTDAMASTLQVTKSAVLKLSKRPEVKAIIQAIVGYQLSQTLAPAKIMSVNELREFWTEAARTTKNQMKDRLRASDLLGKSMGVFIERVDSNVSVKIVREEEGTTYDHIDFPAEVNLSAGVPA